MGLDKELRKMATDFQDTSLLSKISGGDLIAIDAKISHKLFSCIQEPLSKCTEGMC